MGDRPRVGVAVGYRVQLVVRKGVFVVAIPSKLKGFLYSGCALFALLTVGIVIRAARWHGHHCLRAEAEDGSDAKGSGVHSCWENVPLIREKGLLVISRQEKKLQWADEDSVRNREIDLAPEERSVMSREDKCTYIYAKRYLLRVAPASR